MFGFWDSVWFHRYIGRKTLLTVIFAFFIAWMHRMGFDEEVKFIGLRLNLYAAVGLAAVLLLLIAAVSLFAGVWFVGFFSSYLDAAIAAISVAALMIMLCRMALWRRG